MTFPPGHILCCPWSHIVHKPVILVFLCCRLGDGPSTCNQFGPRFSHQFLICDVQRATWLYDRQHWRGRAIPFWKSLNAISDHSKILQTTILRLLVGIISTQIWESLRYVSCLLAWNLLFWLRIWLPRILVQHLCNTYWKFPLKTSMVSHVWVLVLL